MLCQLTLNLQHSVFFLDVAKNNVGGVEIVRFDLKDEAEPQLTYFLLPIPGGARAKESK